MVDIIIRTENISKSYHNDDKIKLEVLKGIDLEIPKNKISVIIGSSGAGKSTLLHILGGLDKPDKGNVFINDINIINLSDDKISKFRNKNIGFVFQFHHLLPEFTALENVSIPLMINNFSFQESSNRGKELLELLGLEERMHHKPAELSGGEQQRVALARALANDPPIILADEPTGNLDTENSEAINQIFLKLKNEYNKTFLIVTHNQELMKLADYVFEIKDGIILK
ncbi:MAG: ABC transporter ATP-binding protein [Ignavibacterium sp.]